jgi:TatD DNase family protein
MTNPPPPVERHGVDDAPSEGFRPGLVDTHCHLFLIEDEPAAVTAAARATGVGRMICVGVDPESSRRSLELAESLRGVFATAGVHPHDASTFDRAAGSTVEELLIHPLVVGVGETGLDHYRRLSPPEDQERAFRTHIALSRETGKPLVVHVRDAWEDVLRILEEDGAERVVIHCFSGDAEIARACAERGYWLSFAGNVTYPKNEHLRQAAIATPKDRLLVETDSPFLAPQPLRGRDNAPQNVLHTLASLAEARDEPLDALVAATASNAEAAFSTLP